MTYRLLLALQDSRNTEDSPKWRELGIPWLRYVAAEGGLALERLSGSSAVDIELLKTTIINIWRFVLSEALVQRGPDAEAYLSRYPQTNLGWGFDGYATRCYDVMDLSVAEHLELLVGFAALRAPLYQVVMMLRTLMVDAGLSVDDMRALYVLAGVGTVPQKIEAHCQALT